MNPVPERKKKSTFLPKTELMLLFFQPFPPMSQLTQGTGLEKFVLSVAKIHKNPFV